MNAKSRKRSKIKDSFKSYNFTVISGYNLLKFDIPLLTARCVKNSLNDLNMVSKIWHSCLIIDQFQQLLIANGNTFRGSSLDNVIATAKKLNLAPPPHNGDGGAMRELYPNGRYPE